MEGGWALQKNIDFIMLIYILIFFSFRGGVTDMISKSFLLQDENAKRNGKLIHVANKLVILYYWNRTSIAEESPGIESQVIPSRLSTRLHTSVMAGPLFYRYISISPTCRNVFEEGRGPYKSNILIRKQILKRKIEYSFWKIVYISETSKI